MLPNTLCWPGIHQTRPQSCWQSPRPIPSLSISVVCRPGPGSHLGGGFIDAGGEELGSPVLQDQEDCPKDLELQLGGAPAFAHELIMALDW